MTQLTQDNQEDNEDLFWTAMKCLHITKCVLEKMKEVSIGFDSLISYALELYAKCVHDWACQHGGCAFGARSTPGLAYECYSLPRVMLLP